MNDNPQNPGKKFKKAKARPTIGFLTYGFGGDTVSYQLWSGIYNYALKRGVDLLCFPGNPPDSPAEFETKANSICDLVSTDTLDGLLIWGGGLSALINADQVTMLYQRFQSIPTVSISFAAPGIPTIGIDNYQGIRELMAHLIQEHEKRRIAFIRGPENHREAEQRYQAYRDALTEFGLPFQSSLIYPGNFKQHSGYEAVNYWLDGQNSPFEAVLAANDRMAIGALEAFAARGIRVPREYAVAGFDGIEESKYIHPPLTTSQQPFPEIGAHAVEMLISLLHGAKVPEYLQLPTKPQFRHSCGCLSQALVQAGAGSSKKSAHKNQTTKEVAASTLSSVKEPMEGNGFFEARQTLIPGLLKAAGSSLAHLQPNWAETLFDSFYHDLKISDPALFIQTIGLFLNQTILSDDDVIIWHGIISAFRRLLPPYLSSPEMIRRAEDLWQQAQILIGEIAEHIQANHMLRVKRQSNRLHRISPELGASLTIFELIKKIAQSLPGIGIPSCYLSLYEDSKAEWARLILAYNQNGRLDLDPEGQRFPSRQLVPNGCLWSEELPRAMVVEPLYFHDQQFGFILFEVGPLERLFYEVLRGQLSSALYRVFLFQERQQVEYELTQSLTQVKKAMEGAVQSMTLTVEMRDPYTAGHQRRVSQLACAIASAMGLPAEQIEGIKLAAIIHDVGKIAIPAEILSKPAKLNEIELAMIRTHPQIGYDILKTIEFPWPIAQIILQHHRRIDGSGYPSVIDGVDIQLEAKIIGVADVVEAMSSHRPYRPALGLDKALEEITKNRGILYDPQIVDICLNLFAKGRFEFN